METLLHLVLWSRAFVKRKDTCGFSIVRRESERGRARGERASEQRGEGGAERARGRRDQGPDGEGAKKAPRDGRRGRTEKGGPQNKRARLDKQRAVQNHTLQRPKIIEATVQVNAEQAFIM